MLGSTQLYWTVLGFIGPYRAYTEVKWAVLGCTGLYWTVLGCIGRVDPGGPGDLGGKGAPYDPGDLRCQVGRFAGVVQVVQMVWVVQVFLVIQVVRVVRMISLDDMHPENTWFSGCNKPKNWSK